MRLEEKLWKWYEKHDNAVNAVLEIAAGIIPGGNLVMQGVKAVYGAYKDKEENEDEEKSREVEEFLKSVKPVMMEIVEEIEDISEFHSASSMEQRKEIVREKTGQSLNAVLSQINTSMTKSVIGLSGKGRRKILNNKYELEKELGSGSQGTVYCARDLEANKLVAVKILPDVLSHDIMAIESLRREYNRVVDQLVHASIVQYRSMAQDTKSQSWFLVMDYVPGKNLRLWMLEKGLGSRGRGLVFSQSVNFLMPIAEALDFAHKNKVVHCDLKPENILIRDSDGKLMLTDFGLAKEIRTSLSKRSMAGDISGTLPYMAPEQYKGKNPDERTDVWALGVMLYELVAGFHPFQGTSFEHFKDLICQEEPDRIEHIQPEEWANTMEEFLHEKTGMEFVYIPGGSFQMGGNKYDNEKPIHSVTLSPYFAAKCPCTENLLGTYWAQAYTKEFLCK